MMKNIDEYKTIVFDCDGVVLNSNRIKSYAFFKAALPYGQTAAQQLLDYHVARGGISRYEKFEWFVQNVVSGQFGPNLEQLLDCYAAEVRKGLQVCDISPFLLVLRNETKHANWLVVSGGDQNELREIFFERDIEKFFDGGIFGSPTDKKEIMCAQINNGNIKLPALFIGDSRYDYIVATDFSLDFLFLHGWTEFLEWKQFCVEHRITYTESLQDLLLNNCDLSSSGRE